jgi:WD40 repeat protein
VIHTVASVTMSQSEAQFLATTSLTCVHIFDVPSVDIYLTIPVLSPRMLAFSADNRLFAVGSSNQYCDDDDNNAFFEIMLWDLEAKRQLRVIQHPYTVITYGISFDLIMASEVMFTSMGDRFITAGNRNPILIWSVESGEQIAEILNDDLASCKYKDGFSINHPRNILAVIVHNNKIQLNSLDTMCVVANLSASTSKLSWVQFNQSGHLIAAICAGYGIYVWNCWTETLLMKLDTSIPLGKIIRFIQFIHFNPSNEEELFFVQPIIDESSEERRTYYELVAVNVLTRQPTRSGWKLRGELEWLVMSQQPGRQDTAVRFKDAIVLYDDFGSIQGKIIAHGPGLHMAKLLFSNAVASVILL